MQSFQPLNENLALLIIELAITVAKLALPAVCQSVI